MPPRFHVEPLARAVRPLDGQLMSFEVELGLKARSAPGTLNRSRRRARRRQRPQESPASGARPRCSRCLCSWSCTSTSAFSGNHPSSSPLPTRETRLTSTFFTYALDKSAARQNACRTPERTLHFLALAGGWPGALLARAAPAPQVHEGRVQVSLLGHSRGDRGCVCHTLLADRPVHVGAALTRRARLGRPRGLIPATAANSCT